MIMENGDETVLSLDVNDAIDGRSNDFSTVVASTGIVYIIAEKHNEVARTCLLGKRRIDFVLLSPVITHAV